MVSLSILSSITFSTGLVGGPVGVNKMPSIASSNFFNDLLANNPLALADYAVAYSLILEKMLNEDVVDGRASIISPSKSAKKLHSEA